MLIYTSMLLYVMNLTHPFFNNYVGEKFITQRRVEIWSSICRDGGFQRIFRKVCKNVEYEWLINQRTTTNGFSQYLKRKLKLTVRLMSCRGYNAMILIEHILGKQSNISTDDVVLTIKIVSKMSKRKFLLCSLTLPPIWLQIG